MKIGLCGGTFDPLHNGHYALVQAALAAGGLDRVLVMPAGRPPHKMNEVVSMAGYRFEMAVQAFTGQDRVAVSDLEILRPGRSYTLDTIRQLQATLPADSELHLIYGSDILNDIEGWYNPEAILAACPLLLARRGGFDDPRTMTRANDLRRKMGARICFFDAPQLELSSTQIRAAIRGDRPYRQWVPDKVAKVIARHGLYRYQDDLQRLPSELWQMLYELERELWPLLNRKRLLHSLNVMLYALHLARIHDVPAEETAIAALLHDCAKCLDTAEMERCASLAGDPSLMGEELAHGPAGAWLARERFGVGNPTILKAIHYHTTGCAGMSTLDKIIFIADKVEPARTYAHLAEIRRLAESDLDQALLLCLQEIDSFLAREKLQPHPYTGEARADLANRLGGSADSADQRRNML